ncbi:hypothetical protein PLESTB_000470100 [Pleodorina starrii]|uniref:Uncharacterized protein n=1 Tax=Pleodorina starrii TaxID=330485 RepID=A0A9W6BFG1_9CHLO|nr:hypothetical protein PLESTM_001596800 [Pleodorina starrii]GLC51139.1 hypothetical protein PLESTB_000470100 [Pleodorina starrii]
MAATSRHAHPGGARSVLCVRGPAGPSEVLLAGGSSNSAVVFFEGDQILDDDTRDLLGPERWSPDAHLATLCGRAGADTSVLLVMPTTLAAGGQACYGNLLASMTAVGEPLGFKPQGYPAATHLAAILASVQARDGGEDGDGGGGGDGDGDGGCGGGGGGPSGGTRRFSELTLVGFSKGAVVLNQLLAEMAWREEALLRAAGDGQESTTSVPAPAPAPADDTAVAAAAATGTDPVSLPLPLPRRPPPPSAAPPEPPSDSVGELLDSIHTLHFLDAGLNCRGVHLTDAAAAAALGQRHRRRPLVVHVHGTPRQWGDRRRPWIAAERDRFQALLCAAGVPAHVHRYFEGQPPSLRQHFDIIGQVQMRPDGC